MRVLELLQTEVNLNNIYLVPTSPKTLHAYYKDRKFNYVY